MRYFLACFLIMPLMFFENVAQGTLLSCQGTFIPFRLFTPEQSADDVRQMIVYLTEIESIEIEELEVLILNGLKNYPGYHVVLKHGQTIYDASYDVDDMSSVPNLGAANNDRTAVPGLALRAYFENTPQSQDAQIRITNAVYYMREPIEYLLVDIVSAPGKLPNEIEEDVSAKFPVLNLSKYLQTQK